MFDTTSRTSAMDCESYSRIRIFLIAIVTLALGSRDAAFSAWLRSFTAAGL